jgi:hypothetical protein
MVNLIGVIGGRNCDEKTAGFAFQVGYGIGKRGFGLICGGHGGVMEHACRGCKESGGITVGILPQETTEYGNAYLDIIIPTGIGIARNLIIVRSALGLIAISGQYGTLSEIAFALELEKPVVGLHTWDISDKIVKVFSPEEAVDTIMKLIKNEQSL